MIVHLAFLGIPGDIPWNAWNFPAKEMSLKETVPFEKRTAESQRILSAWPKKTAYGIAYGQLSTVTAVDEYG